jgi:hypothetical protein
MRELEVLQRGAAAAPIMPATAPALDADDVEDLEDAPDNEVEAAEEEILDQATAARTIAELKAEIETLKRLETLALAVRRSGDDTKWRQLANLLSEIFTPAAIAACLRKRFISVAFLPSRQRSTKRGQVNTETPFVLHLFSLVPGTFLLVATFKQYAYPTA